VDRVHPLPSYAKGEGSERFLFPAAYYYNELFGHYCHFERSEKSFRHLAASSRFLDSLGFLAVEMRNDQVVLALKWLPSLMCAI
jgi:hypothetical protein